MILLKFLSSSETEDLTGSEYVTQNCATTRLYESIKCKESKAPDREDVVGKFLPVLLFNDDSVGFYARKSSRLRRISFAAAHWMSRLWGYGGAQVYLPRN